jgi:hypothetical protein
MAVKEIFLNQKQMINVPDCKDRTFNLFELAEVLF